MVAFIKVFQVAALLLHSSGLCDGACFYPNSWQSMWWKETSNYNVYHHTYLPAEEFSTYRLKTDATDANLIYSYVCVDNETAGPYTYYVRHKKQDGTEECVQVHVSQHAQLMLRGRSALKLYQCSFDGGLRGSTCTMTQDDTDEANWSIGGQRTDTSGTGPEFAYGGRYFIYMESSSPTANGDRMRIHTEALRLVGDVCVQFAYHMYGEHINALHVYLQHEDDDENRTTLWSMEGEQGNMWILERVDVRLTSIGDMIGFEAVRGIVIRGDIALDELVIFSQSCSDVTDRTGNKTLQVAECKTRSDYVKWMEVLVRYPFDFSIPCPLPNGKYQASVKTSPVNHSCVSDSSSFLVVSENTITMQLCLNGSTYEQPFANVELKCVGEVSADTFGGAVTKGKAMVLAFGSSNESAHFYTARYLTHSNGTILMSLQGSTFGELRPDPDKSYSSVGTRFTEFDVALVLRIPPTVAPSGATTSAATVASSGAATAAPTVAPSGAATAAPTVAPSGAATAAPTVAPSGAATTSAAGAEIIDGQQAKAQAAAAAASSSATIGAVVAVVAVLIIAAVVGIIVYRKKKQGNPGDNYKESLT